MEPSATDQKEPSEPKSDPWAPPAGAGPPNLPAKRRPAEQSGLTVAQPPAKPASPVTLTAIELPFWSLVRLCMKLALAAVPALILLFGLLIIALSVLGLILGTAIVTALTQFATNVMQSIPWF